MEGRTIELSKILDTERLSGAAVRVTLLCFLVMVADSYDVAALSFAVPELMLTRLLTVAIAFFRPVRLVGLVPNEPRPVEVLGAKNCCIANMLAMVVISLMFNEVLDEIVVAQSPNASMKAAEELVTLVEGCPPEATK